ncbi:beta-mannosidase [Phocaeicola sp. HCN-40430]|uniref:beta-mannosidase n=1 Tax=Phocaeicola sp. HCN-40430 TaxID=3134664 RepID=UPI004040C099
MKNFSQILRYTALTTFSLGCGTWLSAAPLRMELNEGWQFRQARLSNWYPATVPGVVHTDLMNNGIIEDPYYRLNERGVQWIDKEDWVYESSFSLSDEFMNRQNIDLLFKGLDTYADVYLNDSLILKADNMFREWRVEVKSLVKSSGNILRIYFHSPLKVDIPKWDALPYHYSAGNDQSENGGVFNKKVSVFARKAGYHYGWDWGPRLVTSGIWRPVYVEAWNDARISNVFIRQHEVNEKKAVLTGQVEVVADKEMTDASVVLTDTGNGKVLARVKTSLKQGVNKVELPFVMKNPELWWSNGLGNPHLYTFETTLVVGKQTADAHQDRVGVRSLKVIRKPDAHGTSFFFELNGRPVFMKGANYIPQDNFLPRVTEENYRKTIQDAADVHMNMLRVWGGGIYENDIFYDLCDEYGILVWQDFMFACSLYPAEGEWLENVRREAIDNVRRLRNHPCIAIWCGNNECNEAWYGWGWAKKYNEQNPEYARLIKAQMDKQYLETLPLVVSEEDPDRFYLPSSPFGLEGQVNDDCNGDRHYWRVWGGREPISQYNKERSRFFSEYGFQSFPDFETVKRYTSGPEDWNITSEVMMAHQRGGEHANKLIETYMLAEHREPKDFRSFLYLTQVLQGDAIKIAMEAHRRDMPYCMGSLFWQHNDCWPVASWSSRDYYGRWKAQHYFARKAYSDILLSPLVVEGNLRVYAVSDRREPLQTVLSVEVWKLEGGKFSALEKQIQVNPNTSSCVFEEQLDRLLDGASPQDVVVHVYLKEDGRKCYANNCFLAAQKEMAYAPATIRKDIRPVEGGFEVTLQSNRFARAVYLCSDSFETTFSDNYIDLLPGEPVTLMVRTALSQGDFEKSLSVYDLYEACRKN